MQPIVLLATRYNPPPHWDDEDHSPLDRRFMKIPDCSCVNARTNSCFTRMGPLRQASQNLARKQCLDLHCHPGEQEVSDNTDPQQSIGVSSLANPRISRAPFSRAPSLLVSTVWASKQTVIETRRNACLPG